MADRLKRNTGTLCFLHKHPQYAKGIIEKGDDDLLDCLRLCCKNILEENVAVSPTQKSRLKRHKNTLRKLVQPRLSRKNKKTLLQRGGFLGALLGPIVSLVAPLLQKVFT
jgi:hypothetical protein